MHQMNMNRYYYMSDLKHTPLQPGCINQIHRVDIIIDTFRVTVLADLIV